MVYKNKAGVVVPHDAENPRTVPLTAASVEGIKTTVSWASTGWNLNNASGTFGGSCNPVAGGGGTGTGGGAGTGGGTNG